MGFFKKLFKKPYTIQDDYFGSMTYVEVNKKYGNSYFECRRFFEPSGKEIEIGIECNTEGPTNLQKDFFKKIETEYSKISKSIIPLIEEQFQNWKPEFEIKDFVNEFQPDYLNLPNCEEKPISWIISFNSWHDENHVFEATMKGFIASNILIDG